MRKEYSAESLMDIEQDISEVVDNLPKDDNGMTIGNIIVEVWYEAED